MRKWLILIGVISIIIGLVAFDNKFYYPSLPIESMNKKKVLKSLNNPSEQIVKIAEEKGYDWYITRMDQGKAYENIKKMISKNSWEYQTQEGSGFIFEKEDQKLIAETQMWTGKYVIVQIPEDWEE